MDETLHREIRGRIVKILLVFYPGEVTEKTILTSLNRAGYVMLPPELPREMAYLRDKGYAVSREYNDRYLGRGFTHKITSRGVDLAERTSPPDEGIQLPDDWM